MARLATTYLLFSLLLQPSAVRAGQPSGPAASPDMELSFRNEHGYLIVVEGGIGNLDKLTFILDTGVTRSVISKRIADKLGLQRRPRLVLNFNQNVAVDEAVIPYLAFGPIQKTNVTAHVGRLDRYSDFARDVDAIIGMDFLNQTNFSIDFAAKKILFHPVDTHTGNPDTNCLVVKVEVQGNPVTLILDTGIEGIFLYEGRLTRRIPKLKMAGKIEEVRIGHRMRARQVTLPEVRFGSKLRDATVLLIADPTQVMPESIDGFMGLGPLNARRINIDTVGGTLSWE